MNKKVINLIKKDVFLNMNDLINNINSEKLKVGLYPITDNSWIDVGQWSEYQNSKKKLIKNEMSCCNSSKKWIKKVKK